MEERYGMHAHAHGHILLEEGSSRRLSRVFPSVDEKEEVVQLFQFGSQYRMCMFMQFRQFGSLRRRISFALVWLHLVACPSSSGGAEPHVTLASFADQKACLQLTNIAQVEATPEVSPVVHWRPDVNVQELHC
jgi:hypothetical protein